ncbi:hypothetical protein BZA05DRAFT_417499 [Tricharina praecox]|uniref:uncharacterized protein n=1 Tax=Tricharina praecox TaxID=43433 RepID=UPI00221F9CE7|nr:uncharacterized protein BZA05DRAFT_417499 [Tricharina praecox]KAI5854138.1 hypothetical protein BZA05DRAFT_417499 [Tricharina praecox]
MSDTASRMSDTSKQFNPPNPPSNSDTQAVDPPAVATQTTDKPATPAAVAELEQRSIQLVQDFHHLIQKKRALDREVTELVESLPTGKALLERHVRLRRQRLYKYEQQVFDRFLGEDVAAYTPAAVMQAREQLEKALAAERAADRVKKVSAGEGSVRERSVQAQKDFRNKVCGGVTLVAYFALHGLAAVGFFTLLVHFRLL